MPLEFSEREKRVLSAITGLWQLGLWSKAGLLDAYYQSVIELYEVTQGGLMYTNAAMGSFALTGGVPVVTAVGVWVALGSGYHQAREEAKKEESMSGFSQGFVAAILGWKWHHVVPLFQRPYLSMNKFDGQMNAIRVNSYHAALKSGFLAGMVLPEASKKAYRQKIRSAGNIKGPTEWSRDGDVARNQQVSYVIDMAAAGRRYGIIAPQ
jgi:hypothetical protein